MQPFELSKNLMLGTATAATHIEGGYQEHNWYRWSEEGKIMDGSHCKIACDHINKMEEDVELLSTLNCQTYRLGLEWSRIEPKEGVFSQEGIEIYRKELRLLHQKGIRPLVTLWHFSNPLWFEDSGAWLTPNCVDRVLRYIQFTVEALGDLVEDWITFNEPNVYLTFAYQEGTWPPGKKGAIGSFFKAAKHFCWAHEKAFDLIHDIQKKNNRKANVGVAHHLRLFDPIDNRRLSKFSANLLEKLFQNIFLEAMTKGRYSFPISAPSKHTERRLVDFMGINYYSRDWVKGCWKPLELFGERMVKENAWTNDLGWEIYAEGLNRICTKMWEQYQLPIYITENGVCDSEDIHRPKFIVEHLLQVQKAIDSGVDIQRYYHWSLLDNFEWAEGNSARFGLYHNNFETQERTIRPSGLLYAAILENRAIREDHIRTIYEQKLN